MLRQRINVTFRFVDNDNIFETTCARNYSFMSILNEHNIRQFLCTRKNSVFVAATQLKYNFLVSFISLPSTMFSLSWQSWQLLPSSAFNDIWDLDFCNLCQNCLLGPLYFIKIVLYISGADSWYTYWHHFVLLPESFVVGSFRICSNEGISVMYPFIWFAVLIVKIMYVQASFYCHSSEQFNGCCCKKYCSPYWRN